MFPVVLGAIMAGLGHGFYVRYKETSFPTNVFVIPFSLIGNETVAVHVILITIECCSCICECAINGINLSTSYGK